ncbi:MAG: polyprenyl synthetase family protein [Treponema sp.]|jgi:octaprenyl-diphosphate synthase|nr:polyprenyl synthetase family protein [Treponema sp.]
MDQEYTQRIKKIEGALGKWLPDTPAPAWVGYVCPGLEKKIKPESLKDILAPGRNMLSRGGKRWRPLLMNLVCESLGGGEAALPLSPLVEFCHTGSLIHDDIEDESDERRGKPAVHILYGVDTAINSGAFFYFLASCCIEQCAEEKKSRIYRLWADCLRRLHLGQSMDIAWHREVTFVPAIDDYYVMCGLKTGSLARFAAELGAYTAGASNETMHKLGEAAERLGIGFQILDDVKNLTTGIPGKMRGDDVVEGKKSLPVLLFMNKHPDKRDLIFKCFDDARESSATITEVEDFIKHLNDAGVIKEAEEKGLGFLKNAHTVFKTPELYGANADEKSRNLLAGLVNLIR